jgi:nitroreductase
MRYAKERVRKLDFIELANLRRSTRDYSDRVVDRDKIMRCVEAARMAPSACNSQPWHFIVVDDPELKDMVASATLLMGTGLNSFVKGAPVIVAVINENANMRSKVGGFIKGKNFDLIDIGIAAEHFCLQAAAEGLGTCILGWFNEGLVKKLLDVPKLKKVPLLITLGYEKTGSTAVKVRKSIEDISSFNKYK